MNIVICLEPSETDFQDLRYCLRSIEQMVYGYDEIIFVGECPDWAQGVLHIPFSSEMDSKFSGRGRLRKLIAACISPKNDGKGFAEFMPDFVFLNDVRLDKFPYLYKGTWYDRFKNTVSSKERITAKHTMGFLKNRGFDDRNYDISFPMLFGKEKFLSTFDDKDIKFDTPYGYGINSIYAAANRVKGYPAFSKDLAIEIGSKKTTQQQIEECKSIFKNKSSYEKY